MFTIFQRRRKYPGLDPRTPIAGAGYVAIDTELTGLDEKKDSIVSLGGIKMTGGRIELGSTLDRLVSPRTELRADTVVIHEITPSDVQAEPGIDAAMDEFLSFIGSRILVGHFISIDLEFLNREMKRTRLLISLVVALCCSAAVAIWLIWLVSSATWARISSRASPDLPASAVPFSTS